jgi:8-oxo-dGTP diphosphatase
VERIEAAGVVLVRPGPHGPEVAVVHRPRREDWSLPKGKLDPGEPHDVAAVRETHEETGVRAVLGPYLGHRSYLVDGVAKRVRYWRATVAADADRAPDDEVDEVRWLRRKAARRLLTYADDRALVDAALALPDTEPTVILRHAEATKRAVWRSSGDADADVDSRRPLTEGGVHQAHDLVAALAAYAPRVVVSSDARRCATTVEPYAAHLGAEVRLEHALSEEGCEADPDTTAGLVAELLDTVRSGVWCTHRPVLPLVMRAAVRHLGLRHDRLEAAFDPRLKPGAALVVHRDAAGRVVAADHRDA